MAPETIEYRYSHEGRAARGAWTGERAQAVAAAVEHLRAERDEGHGAWTYVAQETGETWRVDEWELAILGAALLALGGRGDAYSLWCTESGARVERGGATDARVAELCAAVGGLVGDDGTGDLGVIVRHALAADPDPDPDVTAGEVAQIVADARAEHAAREQP